MNSRKMMMLWRTFATIHLAGLCAFALGGCTRNNQLMIRPADGMLTYCSPVDHAPPETWMSAPDERCLGPLETLGFTKAEDVALAGGGGIYLTDDGHVLGSEEMAALSPEIPPQSRSFPPKGSGLEAGDAIIAVNGAMTTKRSEIVPHFIGKAGQHVTVRIRRNNIEQDVTMGFKPWLGSDGNVFYDQKFFFHFEYADRIEPGKR